MFYVDLNRVQSDNRRHVAIAISKILSDVNAATLMTTVMVIVVVLDQFT